MSQETQAGPGAGTWKAGWPVKNRIPDKITFHADADVTGMLDNLIEEHQLPPDEVINHVLRAALRYLEQQRRSGSEDDAFAA